MRRPLFGGRFRVGASSGGDTVAEEAELGEGAVEQTGLLQHDLVLLGQVALEPGEAFFKAVNACVGHEVWKGLRVWSLRSVAEFSATSDRGARDAGQVVPARAE